MRTGSLTQSKFERSSGGYEAGWPTITSSPSQVLSPIDNIDAASSSIFDLDSPGVGRPKSGNGYSLYGMDVLNAPTSSPISVVPCNNSYGDYPEVNDAPGSSPAQRFLSMFSPVLVPKIPDPDTEGEMVAGYILGKVIGRGGFSTVRKAVSASGAAVAVKIIKKSDVLLQPNAEEINQQLENEVAIWTNLNHEHILPLFATERTSYADFIVMLYCPAGSLFNILKRDGHPALPLDDVGMLFRQVVKGLRYLHESARIVHGDLKLENVLVDEAGMCRISDFGLSRRMLDPNATPSSELVCNCRREVTSDASVDKLRRHTTISHIPSNSIAKRQMAPPRPRSSTPHGTPCDVPNSPYFHPGSLPYASPELLTPSFSCSLHCAKIHINAAQDMWALGVLLYALLSGRLPFWDNFEPRLQMKILHGAYELPAGIGHGAERVLRGCLERDIAYRWTVDMVDDVAWGVGWGPEGDADVHVPTNGDHNFARGVENFRKTRSRSRARPYPEHGHPQMGSKQVSYEARATSIFSRSASRSRSRTALNAEERTSERLPLAKSTSHSNSSAASSEENYYPYSLVSQYSPACYVTRGRSSRGSSRSCGPSISRSRSISQSHSRSRSLSSTPVTPSDAGEVEYPPISTLMLSRPVNIEDENGGAEENRGRRRNIVYRGEPAASFETDPGRVRETEAENELSVRDWPSELDQDCLQKTKG